MNKQKFDKSLLKKPQILSKEKNCYLLTTNNENLLKNDLKKQKIDYFYYDFIKIFAINTNFETVSLLSDHINVVKILDNIKVSTFIDIAKNFAKTDSLTNKNKYDGSNITIAFIDTGISPHLDFLLPKNRIKKFVDLINHKESPYDDNGHGTFICGVACSNGNCSGERYSGLAYKSDIVMIKAIDKDGVTTTSKILEAMQYIYKHHVELDIKIVCMSFGAESSGEFDPLVKGVKALWEAGIVVVCAAGNSGPDKSTIKSPATCTKVITVGSIDDGRQDKLGVADFSSRGPAYEHFKPDLVVSGVELHSTSNTQLYTTLSGTSVSTPFVASVVSIMLQKTPTLTPDKVKNELLKHCTPINYNRNSEGSGYLRF